jgi:GMP synthase-like glutamine amidotransferase
VGWQADDVAMRILAIVHQADAGPGVFADAVAAAGHRLEVWHPGELAPDPESYGAVLIFGGGMHPDQEAAHPWLADEKRLLGRALGREVPLLAVCLGAELLVEAAGGSSRQAAIPEIGWYSVRTSAAAREDPLLAGLPEHFEALEWHSYECLLPPGAVALATSEACLQAYRIGGSAWGIQFHAEVTLETFESWLDSYQGDPDAVRLGVEPERLRRKTRLAIHEWNRIGYDLCTRFVQLAGGVS